MLDFIHDKFANCNMDNSNAYVIAYF